MPDRKTKKILIIDDEADTRIFMSNLLSSHGYTSIWAENRTEGLARAMAEDPMVIIIDMMMPGKGGIQIYHDLKREEKLNKIPVIMLSTIDRETFFKIQGVGHARWGAKMHAPEIYLQKPHEAEKLLTLIKKISGSLAAKSKRNLPGRHQ